jgi:hypothetical protein
MHRAVQSALIPVFAIVLAVGAAGCDVAKSESPTSPSVAGAIAGVTISTPTMVDPPAGKRFEVTQLPVTLTVQNSTTNSQRTVKYVFDVASDAGFTTKVVDAVSVAQDGSGKTKYTVDKGLETGKTYFWRVKADDGANQSAVAAAQDFSVYTLSISTPVLIFPTANQRLASTDTPVTLTIQNSTTNGEAALRYIFEVATDPAFNARVYLADVAAGGNDRTQLRIDMNLESNRIYYWRAKATDGTAQSPFSGGQSFSIDPPVVVSVPTQSTPSSPGGSTPSANDAIDLRTVSFVKGENISGWSVTSTITNAGWSNGTLCTEHTKQGKWPALPFFDDPYTTVEGNQIVFAKINGKWYGGSGEWLRPGQGCKGVPADMGPDTFYDAPPLSSWIPRSGETYGLAVSTPSRAGQWGTAERSNVVLVVWR